MRRWASKLKSANSAKPAVSSTEDDVLNKLRTLYQDEKKDVALIPRFYVKKKQPGEVQQRTRKEARTRFLERKAELLLEENEVKEIVELLRAKKSRPFVAGQERINFEAFSHVGAQISRTSQRAAAFFRATVFARFPRDEYGRISISAFHRYIVKKVRLAQFRIALMCYDDVGNGYLREQDLESYVFEQISSMPQLQGLEADFYPYYVFTAVRKFLFFLDPAKKGKIRIGDLVHSPILKEFNRLRTQLPPNQNNQRRPREWFSARSALEVYATYLNLDVDHNGMLSKAEFSRYGGGSLTPVFVDRLFQEYRMYAAQDTKEMEMDYKTFLDFVLAMENKNSPQALQYFWKIFDLYRAGYLTIFTLNYFFRAVTQKMVEMKHEPVDVADVVNEIFDMVKPADPHHITLKDLVESRVGGTVVSILSDVNGFWSYDNREMMMHNSNDNNQQQ